MTFQCLKKLFYSWPSASNFKSFSRLAEHFFLTLGQKKFGNTIPKLGIQLKKKIIRVYLVCTFGMESSEAFQIYVVEGKMWEK